MAIYIFINDCIDCQLHKYKIMKQNEGPFLPFSKLCPFFNHIFSMTTKGPLNPASDGNHQNCVMVVLFCNYIVTVLVPKNIALYAVMGIYTSHDFNKCSTWISNYR